MNRMKTKKGLNRTEWLVLQMSAFGFTAEQLSSILPNSTYSINSAKRDLLIKYEAPNMLALILKMTLQGKLLGIVHFEILKDLSNGLSLEKIAEKRSCTLDSLAEQFYSIVDSGNFTGIDELTQCAKEYNMLRWYEQYLTDRYL